MGLNAPNNRAFRSFCPHLSPLETKRKGVREIRTPYGIVSSGDKRGQIVLNALFIGVFGHFQFVPKQQICPQPGTKCHDCPLYRVTASPHICPICPYIRVLSPLFVPISVFCPRFVPAGDKFCPLAFHGDKIARTLAPCGFSPCNPCSKEQVRGQIEEAGDN